MSETNEPRPVEVYVGFDEIEKKCGELFDKHSSDLYGNPWIHRSRFFEAIREYDGWIRRKDNKEKPL